MSAATIATIVAIGKGLYDLGAYIRERRQARLAARRRSSKPCPPPVPQRRSKQSPQQDGKR